MEDGPPPPYQPPGHDSGKVASHRKTDSLTVPGSAHGMARTASDSSDWSPEPSSLNPDDRRSFEDEHRPLPDGWIMLWDPKSQHSYFVDTQSGRSIWCHPHDDEQWIKEHKDQDATQSAAHGRSDKTSHMSPSTSTASATSGVSSSEHPHKAGIGEKIKNKLTGTTHEERVKKRKDKAEAERRAEQEWLRRRQQRAADQAAYYAQNPQAAAYGPPSCAFNRPSRAYPYGSPYGGGSGYGGYGYGYGGFGYGGLGLGGGLLGGLLLTDLL